MKKILLLALFVPFIFSCEKDDEDEAINVTVQNPTANQTQEEFRIDQITITRAGSSWTSEGDLDLRVVDETNNFNFFDYIATNQGFPKTEYVFAPSNRSEWRVFADKKWYQRDGFTTVVRPWEYKDSETTFSIPISNGSGSSEISFTISGTVVNVRIN